MTVNRAAGAVLAAAVRDATENGEPLTSFGCRMTGEVPGSGRIDGEAAISVKPMAMRMRMTSLDQGSDGALEMRVTGGALYMGGGKGAAKETDGRSWLKFDISGPASQEAAATNPPAGQADQNPAEQVTFLNGSKDHERVGEETVGARRPRTTRAPSRSTRCARATRTRTRPPGSAVTRTSRCTRAWASTSSRWTCGSTRTTAPGASVPAARRTRAAST
ncbi:hypothetical protein ACFQ0Q_24445 [Streptomyces aureus]